MGNLSYADIEAGFGSQVLEKIRDTVVEKLPTNNRARENNQLFYRELNFELIQQVKLDES